MRIPSLTFVAVALFVVTSAGRADGPMPAELPGPLVIVGGGKVPAEAREAFVALAGGPKATICRPDRQRRGR